MELRVCEWARKRKSRHQKLGTMHRQLVEYYNFHVPQVLPIMST